MSSAELEAKRLSIFLDCRRQNAENDNFLQFREVVYKECTQMLSLAIFHHLLSSQVRVCAYLVSKDRVTRFVDSASAADVEHRWGHHPAFAMLLNLVGAEGITSEPLDASDASAYANKLTQTVQAMEEAFATGPPEHLVLFCSVFVTPEEAARSLSAFAGGRSTRQLCCLLPGRSAASVTKAAINTVCHLYSAPFSPPQLQSALQDALGPFLLPGVIQTRRVDLQAGDVLISCKATMPHLAKSMRRCCHLNEVAPELFLHRGNCFAGSTLLSCPTESTRHRAQVHYDVPPPCVLTLVGVLRAADVDEMMLFGDTWVLAWDVATSAVEPLTQLITSASTRSHLHTFCQVFKNDVLVFAGGVDALASPCQIAVSRHFYVVYVHPDHTLRLREIVPVELRHVPIAPSLPSRYGSVALREEAKTRADLDDCRTRLLRNTERSCPWFANLPAGIVQTAKELDPSDTKESLTFYSP